MLVKLTSRAWSLEILAAMGKGVPGRQVALQIETGASRTALRNSVDHLIALGVIRRGAGHGHPLRPEFELTELGKPYAVIAQSIAGISRGDAASHLLRKSWTIPILVVTHKPRYFGNIRADLGAITDRALSQALVGLQAHNWIDRRVDITLRPPRPLYHAQADGALIGETAGAVLAQM